MPGARRNRLLRDYVHSFDPRLDEEPMAPQTCGEQHGCLEQRVTQCEAVDADHETRLRASERRGADLVGRLLWLFVSAVVCGAVSLVVALLTAQGGG